MITVRASDARIIYVGNWDIQESSAIAKNDYCKALLMFSGTEITFTKKGKMLSSFDGAPDCEDTSFSSKSGVHTLFITATCGAELMSFDLEELVDVDGYLTSKMLAEYEDIQNGREVGDGSEFKKIPYKAVMPTEKAKIDGILGEVFENGIKRIKGKIKLKSAELILNMS